jgi:hypothetical protein
MKRKGKIVEVRILSSSSPCMLEEGTNHSLNQGWELMGTAKTASDDRKGLVWWREVVRRESP